MILAEEILTNKCCFYSAGFRSEVLPKSTAYKNLENMDEASHEPIVKDHTLEGCAYVRVQRHTEGDRVCSAGLESVGDLGRGERVQGFFSESL